MWVDQRGSEVLGRSECMRLLRIASQAGDLGRLGISTKGSPIVVPVNFAYVNQEVFIRIGPGSIASSARDTLVAFEVDNVDEERGVAWSVLLRGLARHLPTHDHHQLWKELPEPMVPVPGDIVVAIRGDYVSGRRFALDRTVTPAART